VSELALLDKVNDLCLVWSSALVKSNITVVQGNFLDNFFFLILFIYIIEIAY